MKAGLLVIMTCVGMFFLGRWEGKRAADNYYATKPIKAKHLVRGMHFTGKCFIYPGNDSVVYSDNTFTINGDRPCVISPGPVGVTSGNENEEAPRFEQ